MNASRRATATAKAQAQAARQTGDREAGSWAREQAAHDRTSRQTPPQPTHPRLSRTARRRTGK